MHHIIYSCLLSSSVSIAPSLLSFPLSLPALAGSLYASEPPLICLPFFLPTMAHKHNRRRGRRTRSHEPDLTHRDLSSCHSLDQFIISKSSTPSEACRPFTSIISSSTSDATTRRRSNIPAKLWHNRYTAWLEQDRVQKEQAARFEAQQIQLFGGEPGDDVELCYKMLEYFGGLDYIS